MVTSGTPMTHTEYPPPQGRKEWRRAAGRQRGDLPGGDGGGDDRGERDEDGRGDPADHRDDCPRPHDGIHDDVVKGVELPPATSMARPDTTAPWSMVNLPNTQTIAASSGCAFGL